MDDVIGVHEVGKRYRQVVAVDTVSLTVGQGDIYALLGLNGAGKTTLIRMILGMVRPSSGTVTVFGRPVTAQARDVWAQVGYLVETAAAYPGLTVRENLEVVRRLRRIVDRTVVDEVVDRLGLAEYADRRAGTLSLGNAQRLGLAKALIHRPRLLILDEPANGLDPAGVVEIRDLLLSLAAAGTTVFLSSHVLAEVARLASRIGIIHAGRMRTESTAIDLMGRLHRWLEIETVDDRRAAPVLSGSGFRISASTTGLTCADQRAVDRPDEVAVLLVQAGCPPTRLAVVHEDLEAYFLRTVGEADA